MEEIVPTEDGILWSRVRGKNGRRYEPRFGLTGDPGHATCDCGRRGGCEHIVASLLAARANAARWRRQLAHQPAASPSPPSDALPTTRPELERWAREHGVDDILRTIPEAFADALAERRSPHAAMVRQLFWAQHGLGDILVAHGGVRSPKALRELAEEFLLSRAAARARFHHDVRAARDSDLTPTDPRLAPYLAELRRQRAALLERGVLPRPHDEREEVQVDVLLDPVRFRVQRDAWDYGHRQMFVDLAPPDRVTTTRPPGVAPDARVFEALDYATLVLTTPENAAVARRVADDLSKAPWERLVGDLREAFGATDGDDAAQRDFELGWRLTLRGRDASLSAVECRSKARGGWKTRKLKDASLPELVAGGHPGDATALRTIELAATNYRSQETDQLALALTLPALVGHPRFFIKDGRERHVRLKRGRLAFATRDVAGGFVVGFDVDGRFVDVSEVRAAANAIPIDHAVLLVDEANATATLCPTSTKLEQALAHAERRKLDEVVVPAERADVLVTLARDVAGRVPLALSEGLRGPTEPGDPEPRVRLTLGSDGLQVRAIVVPAPELASETPGEGPRELYLEREGALVVLRRDLARERHAARALWDALGLEPTPDLSHVEAMGDAALDLVHALSERPEVAVEWATEERVSVSQSKVDFDALTLEARKSRGRGWFTMHGGAELAGSTVPLPELLRAIRERQRYVRVDDGSWARIDDAVSTKLAAIAKRDGKVPRLMAPLVGELEEAGATLDGFAELSESLDRLRRARGLVVAAPAGLAADLRPYQREGFQWLARLAEWAPGACLADDMGLGKTIQALALLLHRRQTGPALVVAPTSLGFNWVREAERFAPSLRVLPVRSGAELAALGRVGASDVVVTSYGLVARHVDLLSETAWGTLVADEAQAVKNAGTLRARALRQLEAEFTLALTGTPVENRTTELWSLFRLIAPGLLGGEEAFREGYAAPIERGDAVARAALAGLVAPFVLRRLKRDVARELPERTEVSLEVVLRKAERARYEEIRRATLDLLDGGGGQQAGLAALQALTRLRQVACHPALIDPGWAHGSAKLDALMELLERLGEEGHRALVFSQFTSLLALVRTRLEAASIRHLYLDGQTPVTARQARVDAFQAGQADVFLLSLRAGGTGLNLTAATYVIHLDPWWNPAVEDQATDRAHRIGQEQPVTVYRLIAKDTVEEGIVTLHADKRELADALLAGSGSSASLSYDEMVALIGGYAATDALVDDEEDGTEDDDTSARAGEGPAPDRVVDLAAARAKRALPAAVRPPLEPPPTAPPHLGRGERGAPPASVLAAVEAAIARAVANREIAGSTGTKYLSAARRFVSFAEERGLDARDDEALTAYLAALEAGSVKGGKSQRAMVRAAFRWFPRGEA